MAPRRTPAAQTVRALRRSLLLLGTALLGLTAVAEVLVHDGPIGTIYGVYLFPVEALLYFLTGLLAWWRRPANRLGSLMVLAGVAILAGSLANTEHEPLIAVGAITATLPLSVVVHLVHACPSGEVRGRLSGGTVVAAYVVGLVLQAPIWAFTPEPPPFDVLLVSPRPDLAQTGTDVQQYAGLAVVAVTVVLLARRLRDYDRTDRRLLASLLGYAIVTTVGVPIASDVLRPLGADILTIVDAQLAALAIVPLGFLLLVLRGGFSRPGDLRVLVESVAASPVPASVRALDEAVAKAVGDPAARLLRWSPQGYVDSAGASATLPAAEPHLTTLTIAGPDRPLGAIVLDTTLGADPAELAAVTSVVGIALEREGLARTVSESAVALQEASRRLFAAGDAERRRIARDLHDGLQGSLVLLSLRARHLAESGTSDSGPAGDLADGLDAAARTLRRLVDGVMPGHLVDGGLATAVGDLAAGMPLPVEVSTGPLPDPLPEPVETTAYFVVAEALTNVVKHARATRAAVLVRSDGDVLTVEVSDDGVGGAGFDGAGVGGAGVGGAGVGGAGFDGAGFGGGSGLPGLRDRVAVLGGTLEVLAADRGTRLAARIPCA